MNSERSAHNLLRNVYRAKGSTDFAISRLEPDVDSDYPRVKLILRCIRCGAEVGCLFDVCPVCGRINALLLESKRVERNRDFKARR